MTDNTYQLLAIILYMVAMLAIGWYSFKKTSNLTDYMLGGRSLGPAVTALSAGASDMSGWLLMGLPGGGICFWISRRLDCSRFNSRCIFELVISCTTSTCIYTSIE